MSLWNGDTIRDVSESVGVPTLSEDVAKNLAMDVEYRINQVLQEALKFMRHSKRTTLGTQDISNALRVLDVEPLYGYEAPRALRYGEASLGQAQPIFYVEDDEVDFEKLINSPLPKVPRDVTFTGMFAAVFFTSARMQLTRSTLGGWRKHIGLQLKGFNLQHRRTLRQLRQHDYQRLLRRELLHRPLPWRQLVTETTLL
jgi:histone H3/H4